MLDTLRLYFSRFIRGAWEQNQKVRQSMHTANRPRIYSLSSVIRIRPSGVDTIGSYLENVGYSNSPKSAQSS